MAWTDPETFTAGRTLTAASMNAISGNLTATAYGNVIGRVERTTAYAVNQTAIASAADIFASDVTWTADGTTAYLVEMFVPRADSGSGGFISYYVTDGGSTALAAIGFTGGTSGVSWDAPLLRWWYTPASGSVTINARATYGTAAGTLYAGTAGATQPAAYLAVFGPA
jgi:hypothetical protein